MSDEDERDGKEPAATTGRKPYVKPGIAWEEPLEDRPNLIAACAQLPAGDAACTANPTS